MAVTAKPLFDAQQTAAAETQVYAAPAGTRTIIDKFTAYNSTAAVAALSIKLVPAAGAPAASNQIVQRTLAVGEAYTFPEVIGHVLNPGDKISVLQSVANALTLRASGREVT
jgi:hypothetical protein